MTFIATVICKKKEREKKPCDASTFWKSESLNLLQFCI